MLAWYCGDPSLARIIAHDAELPLERVTWRGTPEVLWEDVLEVASACGRLDALLERVAQDYPDARPLHDEFRREQAS